VCKDASTCGSAGAENAIKKKGGRRGAHCWVRAGNRAEHPMGKVGPPRHATHPCPPNTPTAGTRTRTRAHTIARTFFATLFWGDCLECREEGHTTSAQKRQKLQAPPIHQCESRALHSALSAPTRGGGLAQGKENNTTAPPEKKSFVR
jgi:hypothetical protein